MIGGLRDHSLPSLVLGLGLMKDRWAKWKDINWLWVAVVLTAVYVTGVTSVVGWADIRDFFTNPKTELNAIGDFLSGTFAPIAVVWLVAGVMTQRQELGDAREQFRENQEVIDKQLKTIDSQNKLLSLQHEQSVENAKKAYKLSLFDKRFEIYEKFIQVGHCYKERPFDHDAYWAMINLSLEASFVFDQKLTEWFVDIAIEIDDFLKNERGCPWEYADDGFGNPVLADSPKNDKLQYQLEQQTNRIREFFFPETRIGKFRSYMNVSDQPDVVDG